MQAKVRLDGPEETLELLRSFGDDLRFLLITSGVEFGATGEGAHASEKVPGFRVEVLDADGTKCSRCWQYTTDVGADDQIEGVCSRCATHVRAILADRDEA